MCSEPQLWLFVGLLVSALGCGCTDSDPGSGGAAVGGQAPTAECPPPGPYGYEVGTQLTNLEFDDCAGQPASLHALCGAKVGLIVNFYGWCSSCHHLLEMVHEYDARYGPNGLESLVVVVEDGAQISATAAYCDQAREHFGLTGTMVVDPEATMEAYGKNGLVILTDPTGTIVFKRTGATEQAIEQAIEQVLAASGG